MLMISPSSRFRGVSISPPPIVWPGKRSPKSTPFSCCPDFGKGGGGSGPLSPFLSSIIFGPFPKLGGKLGWPWRWPLFVDFILAASKYFPSPISVFKFPSPPFFFFYEWIAAEGWRRRSQRNFDNAIISLTFALSPFFPESKIGTDQDRESVERGGLREQKEGGRGTFGRAGERPSAGRQLQGGGYLRAAASSSTSLFGEDHGKIGDSSFFSSTTYHPLSPISSHVVAQRYFE